ncbi:hypothetical protein U0070_015532 [Myodes glareolus]|uniref:Uncharacterized protein n=1 Tax=Myodes glareolus TaxID=447135 RepID=A0AAW0IFH9_MYOGA
MEYGASTLNDYRKTRSGRTGSHNPHWSSGLRPQGPNEEQKEGKHEKGSQDHEGLVMDFCGSWVLKCKTDNKHGGSCLLSKQSEHCGRWITISSRTIWIISKFNPGCLYDSRIELSNVTGSSDLAKRAEQVGIVALSRSRYGASLGKMMKKTEISQHAKYTHKNVGQVQEGECPDRLDPQNPVYAEETSPSAIVNGFSERLRVSHIQRIRPHSENLVGLRPRSVPVQLALFYIFGIFFKPRHTDWKPPARKMHRVSAQEKSMGLLAFATLLKCRIKSSAEKTQGREMLTGAAQFQDDPYTRCHLTATGSLAQSAQSVVKVEEMGRHQCKNSSNNLKGNMTSPESRELETRRIEHPTPEEIEEINSKRIFMKIIEELKQEVKICCKEMEDKYKKKIEEMSKEIRIKAFLQEDPSVPRGSCGRDGNVGYLVLKPEMPGDPDHCSHRRRPLGHKEDSELQVCMLREV